MNALNKDLQLLVEDREKQLLPVCNEDAWRLAYHIMPPIGWLNDPNGLCYYKGNYHVFFQYSPFDAKGGIKFWGHYTSTDLLHWDYKGVPLCPDEIFDCHGIYSGSALAEDENITLFYTGNVKLSGDFNYITDGREGNTISTESIDGFQFTHKKCLMKNKDYPQDLTCHVRDPKVWKEKDSYYMVQGARRNDDVGEVLLFQSSNKEDWILINRITSQVPFGYMWECPDYFKLDNDNILCISPQGVKACGNEFRNIYQSGYYFVSGDIKGEYQLSRFKELDRGFDYYAPQSFLAPDGRRIQIGWMGLPDIDDLYENPTTQRGWQHALTLPRELSIIGGKLIQQPIRELKELRKSQQRFQIEQKLELTNSGCFELEFITDNTENDFTLILDDGVILRYSCKQKDFKLEFRNDIGCGRKERNVVLETFKSLQLFVDHSSLELFINNGEEVFTSRFYPLNQEHSLSIDAAMGKVTIWNLE